MQGLACFLCVLLFFVTPCVLTACDDGSNAGPEAEIEVVDCSALETKVLAIVSAYEVDDASVSVAFEYVGEKSGGFQIAGDKPMASASIIKLTILATLFEAISAGEVSFDQVLVALPEDVVAGAGIGILEGQELTIREAALLMISESDNTASNMIISLLGIEAMNACAEDLGLGQTVLARKFMMPNSALSNLTSANDLAMLLALIAEDELVSPELSQIAQEFLLAQSDREGLPAGLSHDISIGNKTGSLAHARNDAGILYSADGAPCAVLAVMTNDMGEYEANQMMGEISSVVCEELDAEKDKGQGA